MFKEGFLNTVYYEKPAKEITTKYPPEANGYLHIGHSKAIVIDFGIARHHNGVCYLRFDDTNPEAEEAKYFTAIEQIIEWLGFTPFNVTYSSDNFDKLYELAEALIRRDGAYLCHCSGMGFSMTSTRASPIRSTDTEIKLQRGGKTHGPRYAYPHRNVPPEESLEHFEQCETASISRKKPSYG